MTSATRAAISESIETTSAVLNALTPEQFEQVRAETQRRMLELMDEWMPHPSGKKWGEK